MIRRKTNHNQSISHCTPSKLSHTEELALVAASPAGTIDINEILPPKESIWVSLTHIPASARKEEKSVHTRRGELQTLLSFGASSSTSTMPRCREKLKYFMAVQRGTCICSHSGYTTPRQVSYISCVLAPLFSHEPFNYKLPIYSTTMWLHRFPR